MSRGAHLHSDEIPPGTLYLLILKTLARYGEMHGYEIANSIQQTSDDVLQVEEGSLYPGLYRLELEGAIASKWGLSENNRKARFYSISKAGRKQLIAETENWERVSGVIGKLLQLKA